MTCNRSARTFAVAVLAGWLSATFAQAQWIGPAANDSGILYGDGTIGEEVRGDRAIAGRANQRPARESLGCTTRISYSPAHGTQVFYLQPDGTVFLWYPGNTIVLRGRWKIAPQSGICFLYGANTYNPVTQRPGGRWECRPISSFRSTLAGQAGGDVFGLASQREVPFILSREHVTIEQLRQRMRAQAPDVVRRAGGCG